MARITKIEATPVLAAKKKLALQPMPEYQPVLMSSY